MNIIKGLLYQFSLLSPLTTDDAIWRRQTLAACYQFVLKIAFELAKRQDRGRWVGFSSGCRANGSCSASAQGAVHMATAQHRVP